MESQGRCEAGSCLRCVGDAAAGVRGMVEAQAGAGGADGRGAGAMGTGRLGEGHRGNRGAL